MRLVLLAHIFLLTQSSLVFAQQNVGARLALPEQYHAFLVEGRVVRADGRPAAGVDVVRTENANGLAPDGLPDRTTTAADGAFRFEGHGLGPGPSDTWHLAVRPAGCPYAVVTVTTQRDERPGQYARDLSTGTVVHLPACVANANPPAPRVRTGVAHSEGDDFVLQFAASRVALDACFGRPGHADRLASSPLQLRLVIQANGHVSNAVILNRRPQLTDAAAACIEHLARTWRFAATQPHEFNILYGYPTDPQ